MAFRVFVDTDVIISSLISSSGAAYLLLNHAELDLFISNISLQEQEAVVTRLQLEKNKLTQLIEKRFQVIQLATSLDEIKTRYEKYIFDKNDAHIVAGACESTAKFLISYNIKDFKAEKLKKDFNIFLVTPANLLQYLRSI